MIHYVKQTIEIARNQKVEIERLQGKTDIERIRELTRVVYDKEIAEAKAEAIKEFAERLKQCTLYVDGEGDLYKINSDAIDNLVKEMVGE